MLKKQRAQLVLNRLNELYPETPVPLNHSNHFELLVAVLLSAQCTDERVNQVTPALFALANNAASMQHVNVEEIYNIVRPCGLAPQKSKAISNLSKILNLSSDRISVKATTSEGLGFTGRKEGIAAQAIITVRKT